MTQLFIPGTALPSQVLLNQLFSAGINYNVPGTMPNNGALNQSLAINGTYTIPAGYTTGGNVTQSIPTKSAQTYTPGTVDQSIVANQYLSGAQTIAGDPDLIASNILNTANIFNIQGTAINGAGMDKYASGSGTTDSGAEAIVSTLSFQPSMVEVISNGEVWILDVNKSATINYKFGTTTSGLAWVNASGFKLTLFYASYPFTYRAWQ